MYLWDITINGMGNQFYAGAVQAGSTNWEALLFGSLDTQNFITVDKPPVSQWVMGLSGQIFGFSSASMLIPEALMGVASVALLYAAVARITTPRTGLLAGAALALTPVVALMFRYNNPDAVMVLLMMAAAYCAVRAMQRASAKWLVLAGVALGFAFLAKMLEGLMVMPAIGLAYLVVAPTPLRRRLLHLLASLMAFVVSAGWFVAVTLLWPASSRPYIAGSTDNSFMNLVLGYNGFSRVLGRNHFDFERPGPEIGSAIYHGGIVDETSAGVNPARYVAVAQFQRVLGELNQMRAERASERAERAVDDAIKAGKLIPAQRQWAISYCQANFKGFADFVARQPAAFGPSFESAAATFTPPQAFAATAALTATETAVCAQLGLSPEDYVRRKRSGRGDFLRLNPGND